MIQCSFEDLEKISKRNELARDELKYLFEAYQEELDKEGSDYDIDWAYDKFTKHYKDTIFTIELDEDGEIEEIDIL